MSNGKHVPKAFGGISLSDNKHDARMIGSGSFVPEPQQLDFRLSRIEECLNQIQSNIKKAAKDSHERTKPNWQYMLEILLHITVPPKHVGNFSVISTARPTPMHDTTYGILYTPPDKPPLVKMLVDCDTAETGHDELQDLAAWIKLVAVV